MKRCVCLMALICILLLAAVPVLADTVKVDTGKNLGLSRLPESFTPAVEKSVNAGSQDLVKVKVKPTKKTLYLGDEWLLPGPDDIYVWWRGTLNLTGYTITSSNPNVVAFDGDYAVAKAKGTAKLVYRVYSATGKSKTASVKVTVKYAPTSSVNISRYEAVMTPYDTVSLNGQVSPWNANPKVTYKSSNKKVATVSSDGVVTAIKKGTCKITATSGDKKKKAVCKITVNNTVTRRGAVIVEASGTNGDPSAAAGEKKARTADYNGMASLFKKRGVKTSKLLNPTGWPQVQTLLRKAYAGSDYDDVNYLYIEAHGGNSGSDFIMAIGKNYAYDPANRIVTARQLRNFLDTIPGKKVIILESCHSGTAIGKGAQKTSAALAKADAQLFIDAFKKPEATAKSGELAANDYYVLCATNSSNNSWFFWNSSILGKKKFNGSLFTYGFARGAGWDLVSKKACTQYADTDGYKKKLTVSELGNYASSIVQQAINEYNSYYPYDPIYQYVTTYASDSSYNIFVG